MKIILVYHDPGLNEGYKIIEDLVLDVRKAANLDVLACPISTIEAGGLCVDEGDLVFALLPFRGGHLEQVRRYTVERGGVFAGKIPLELIAEQVLRSLQGCSTVVILYWRAKRFVEEQEEDLRYLGKIIEENLAAKVFYKTSCDEECYGKCVVVTSLLPGRLTIEASRYGDVRIPYLMVTLRDVIVSWIQDYVMRFNYLKTSKVG